MIAVMDKRSMMRIAAWSGNPRGKTLRSSVESWCFPFSHVTLLLFPWSPPASSGKIVHLALFSLARHCSKDATIGLATTEVPWMLGS